MPNVSVITAVHADTQDKVNWLLDAARSVSKQDFDDWEMIVVDDSSTTDISGIKDIDARIRLVRTVERNGPARSRNTAVGLARAEAILPLDADDMLADGAMRAMWDAWQEEPSTIIYGNMQRLENRGSGFVAEKTIEFPEYEFRKALDPQGLIPITAMHSRECHVRAGGWKAELEALEDVEYWIAAGKAGFCGRKIPFTTLIYRRHDYSRTAMMRRVPGNETQVGAHIRRMHEDVYNGRYPMGCCGSRKGGGNPTPPANSQANQVTALTGYAENELVWVRYKGPMAGSFRIVGQNTSRNYIVYGQGHTFQVHVTDIDKFRRMGRGKHYVIGVSPPAGATQTGPPSLPIQVQGTFQAAPPDMAQIERLDEVASEGLALPKSVVPESVAIHRVEPIETAPPSPIEMAKLDGLGLGALQSVLEADGWTIEKIAEGNVSALMQYKGVGPTRAVKLIERAQEVLHGSG